MVLAFEARVATQDVDAVLHPATVIREAAGQVATRLNLPPDRLNDGVKGFLSERHETTSANLPQFANLRVTMPVPTYLLAMKCMAARLGGVSGEPSDVADIRFLIRRLDSRSADDVLDIVARYYPANRISPKTQFLVEGLFSEGLR